MSEKNDERTISSTSINSRVNALPFIKSFMTSDEYTEVARTVSDNVIKAIKSMTLID